MGSGQGDPLSSILFLIGSEPLNRLIASSFPNLMYVTREGIRVGPVIFADDNLSPLSPTRADQITPILDLYNRYTGVSGLNINVRKSTILCINSTPELTRDLQNQGFSTPATIRHLGIELGPTIQTTITETISKIDLKTTRRRILATAPPTDILHRATLINSALTPLYNHVLMALPATEADLQPLYKEIKSFLWTRTENNVTVQKRRLVVAKRLSASFDKGGLQILHPSETAEGLRLNLIQKYFRKINNNQQSTYSLIIEQILSGSGRPDLTEHINRMGPQEWMRTSTKIANISPMLSEAFKSMANFLKKIEDSHEDWHHAPIWGHTRTHKLFPFYPADIATLQTLQINTVSQIFETHLSGGIDKNLSLEILNSLQTYPSLQHKLRLFAQAFQRMPFRHKYASPRSILATLIQSDTNMSRRNKLLCRSILDADIGIAPAYQTGARDNVHIRPTIHTFNNATPPVAHIQNERNRIPNSKPNNLDQQQSVQIENEK
jgi:hypothetical protein